MDNNVSRLVEALVFASPEPIEDNELARHIQGLSPDSVPGIINSLNQEYEAEKRAFRIIKGAGGYRFTTQPEFGEWVKKLVVGSGRIRLSRAALETVSMIAYRQPVSRVDIEAVRGVDVSGILRMLLERRLIRIVERSRGAGRALLYGTTPEFLRHFGLNSIDELPIPEELVDKEKEENSSSRLFA